MKNFDLDAWDSEESRTHYTYEVVGSRKDALRVVRDDKSSAQTFSRKTYKKLKDEGRLQKLSATTFKVEIDPEWNPDSQWDDLD